MSLEVIGLLLGAAALIAALAVPAFIEATKRPKLDIVPSPWSPGGPVSWTFAAVQVHNRPLEGLRAAFLARQHAQACVVEIDYYRSATGDRAIPTVIGRWSSHPEPIRSVPSSGGGAASASATSGSAVSQGFTPYYDPSLDPREHDVPASRAGEEVAVAILTPQGAYAFSRESYGFPSWANPAWRLGHDTYRIVVRVRGSSVECECAFKLEYLDNDFSKFRLHALS